MNGQLNVTPIESKQPQPACKFSITCALDGFPIAIEGEGRASDLRAIVDRLKATGAQPPSSGKTGQKSDTPTCPVHHTPMKPSRKPGSYFCPRRTEDGDYCPEKA